MHALESILAAAPVPLMGYVGLGPGPEFIPYFLALLGVVGAALIALVQWPLFALQAFLRRRRHPPGQQEPGQQEPGQQESGHQEPSHPETGLEPAAANTIEKDLDATHDGTGP